MRQRSEFGSLPAPMPDVSKLPQYHYLPLQDTSTTNEDGTPREVDVFAPMPNLKRLFSANEISPSNTEAITAFSLKYITDKQLVLAYLNPFTQPEMCY